MPSLFKRIPSIEHSWLKAFHLLVNPQCFKKQANTISNIKHHESNAKICDKHMEAWIRGI
eukprot:764573-Amphidinium_carterae.1